jgi:hypothetical protein
VEVAKSEGFITYRGRIADALPIAKRAACDDTEALVEALVA